jgi:TPR repeat protein
MSVTTIEVFPDTSKPAGGHAIIRLKGVALLSPGAIFRISPIDDMLHDADSGGWPHGDLRPLSTRQTPEGIELHVGPDIVDAPLLEPGTPVTITVPDGHVSAELVWPDLPMSSRQASAPFVMTPSQMAAELAATERAKTEIANAAAEATRLQQAAAKRVKEAAQSKATKPAIPARAIENPNVVPSAIHADLETMNEHDRLAAAARELEAALALEGQPPARKGAITKGEPAQPMAEVEGRITGNLTSEALSTLASTTGTSSSGAVAAAGGTSQSANEGIQSYRTAERQRVNASSLSSLKTAPDRPDPLILQTEREMSLPTIILKHQDSTSGASAHEPTRLRREPTIDGHIAANTLATRLMPFLAGASAAGIAAAAVIGVLMMRQVTPGAAPTGAEWAQSAAGRKATLAEAFTVGAQSPRGEIAGDVDLPTALRLADYNLHGVDRPIDRAEAEFWLKKAMSLTASHSQIRWAMTQLGTLSAEPVTGSPDYEKARLLWEIAAANGDPIALCFLGTLAENGLGLTSDRSKALDYYKRSKDFGGCPTSDEAITRLSK